MPVNEKIRAPRNRTIHLSSDELSSYEARLVRLSSPATVEDLRNRTVNQDLLEVIPHLPSGFADMLFLDPPYNLTKSFNQTTFARRSQADYGSWFSSWFVPLLDVLKPTASVYVCADWRSSGDVHRILEEHLIVRNRITWEREKGRGAKSNWKNCLEDIWFCSVSDVYTFDVEAVKLRKRVLAPYTDYNGRPKDWARSDAGAYRLTHPSNLWTDLTVPFWSMSENTDHPTQKPEKLLAKLILASTSAGEIVFDPFVGSGTSSVVAKKFGRQYIGIELDRHYCCLAEKRLALADRDRTIQGYSEGVFSSGSETAPGVRALALDSKLPSACLSEKLLSSHVQQGLEKRPRLRNRDARLILRIDHLIERPRELRHATRVTARPVVLNAR